MNEEDEFHLTSDPSSEGTPSEVLVVVSDQYVLVVSRPRGQVGDSACPILVVLTADLCFRRTLDG